MTNTARNVALLLTGSELLDGRTQDSNSHYLAELLETRGLSLQRVVVCGDDEAELVKALNYLTEAARTIIVSGGLGPTTDDLTREAVAAYFRVGLKEDPEVVLWLTDLFARRGRTMDPSNLKQATFPESARVIPNPIGTAPGFVFKHDQFTVFALPGVPREFEAMMHATVLPALEQASAGATPRSKEVIRVLGIAEAAVNSRIKSCAFYGPNRDKISISYRALFPEIQVILRGANPTLLRDAASEIVAALGPDHVFSKDLKENFENVLHSLLLQRKVTISTAESCTGGLVGSYLTKPAGASAYYQGGVISYTNEAKSSMLGVSPELLRQHGAVSSEVAKAMAAGCRERFKSDLAVSVTGIAGPDGGTAEKPVGTFYIGFSHKDETAAFHIFFPSEREMIQRFAAYTALDLVRRHLLSFNLLNERARADVR